MANDPLLESFFRHLAARFDSENDLSDLTWALCETYPEAKVLFANFLGAPASAHAIELKREFKFAEGCRVDFVCWIDEIPLLIESKINDQNCHLRQYREEARRLYPKSLLAMLSVRDLSTEEVAEAQRGGWAIRRWPEFIEHLASQGFAHEPLIQAYVKYARQVCSVIEIRPIKLDSESLYSLASFQEIAKGFVNSASHGDFVYSAYKSARQNSGPGWTGINYSITHKPTGREVWPWFGLGLDGLDDLEPHVLVALDNDWNRSFLKAHRDDLKRVRANFRVIEQDGDRLSIQAPKGFVDKLVGCDLQTQHNMLKEVFSCTNALLEARLPVKPTH